MVTFTPMVGVEAATMKVVEIPQAHININGKHAGIARKVGNLTLFHGVTTSEEREILKAAKKFLRRKEIPVVRLSPPPVTLDDNLDPEYDENDVD